MAKKKETVVSMEFLDVPSAQLLTLLHAAKAKKDATTAERIAAEFLRRDHVAVNRSILGR